MRFPWQRRRREAELDEEIAAHLAMAARDHEARGEAPDEAAYAARREFGNATLVKEITRQSWGGAWRDHLVRDARLAVRSLIRRPGYAIAAVLCFALGIGANVAMFGVVDTLLFRAPPHVRDAHNIVRLYFHDHNVFESLTSFPTYADLAAGVPAFASVGAFWRMDAVVGRGVGAEKARASLVSSSYLALLGVQPVFGRLFGQVDDRPGALRAVILCSAYARRLFGSDSEAVGRYVTVGASPYSVIGVLPADFTGVSLNPVDLWLPLSVAGPDLFGRDALTNRHDYWLQVVARLDGRGAIAEAAAQASLVYKRSWVLARRDTTAAYVVLGPAQAARAPQGTSLAKLSTRLGALSVLLLLIACANVANLLLARALTRRQETAVRLALGAGRTGLVRQPLMESFVLALVGGLAAVLVGLWVGALVRGAILPDGVASIEVTGRTLAFTGIVALVVGLATGVLPALQASRAGLVNELKATGPRGSTRRSRAQTALLVCQVALTVLLVAGAGLFVRSLKNVLNVDPGYDARDLLVATVDFRGTGYPHDRAVGLYRQLLERAKAIPGVESAALTQAGPLEFFFGVSVEVPGRGVLRPQHGTYTQWVSADYFKAMGSRLVRGRTFTAGDRLGAPKVAVMGDAMARLAFPGEDPVGQCVMLGSDKGCTQVVGVVADAKQWSVTETAYPIIYTPLDQDTSASPTTLYIRAPGRARALVPVARRELQAVDPTGPYVDVASLAAMIDPQFRPWRLGATMLGLFGALAVVLSGLGLYSVLAYVVGQRTREIGVRVALGAGRGNLFAVVLRDGLRVVAAGVVFGVIVSLALGKLVASLLYDVSPRDPLVLAVSALVLFVAAVLACMIPARRAARVDPMEALRCE